MHRLADDWLLCGVVACLTACGPSSRTVLPAQLSTGASDTVVINSYGPTLLGMRALDAAGRPIPDAPIRYARVRGADIALADSTGAATCSRPGDAVIRASLGPLARHLVVRCRPVEHVRLPGPVQFILGDSLLSRPQPLPVEAYARGGQRVTLLAGSAQIADSNIVGLRGITLYPRKRGITVAGVQVGGRSAGIGVHIYHRVSDLKALDTLLSVPPAERLFAVPLRLERGQYRRQRLPPGGWMLAMLPEVPAPDSASGAIRLRIEGAACQANFLNTPRRFGCRAGPEAAVVVYLPLGSPDSVATADLLVRRL